MYFLKIVIAFLILSSLSYAELLSVQVKHTFLRDKPSFLGKPILKLDYANQVENTKLQNGWHLVKSLKSGTVGWVHDSALSDKAIVLNSSQKVSTTSVSQSEVLMAGKGFNKQVETEYTKGKDNLNFSAVNKLESMKPQSINELSRFAKNGKLSI